MYLRATWSIERLSREGDAPRLLAATRVPPSQRRGRHRRHAGAAAQMAR
jgi:hypothetical protein